MGLTALTKEVVRALADVVVAGSGVVLVVNVVDVVVVDVVVDDVVVVDVVVDVVDVDVVVVVVKKPS